MMKKFYFFSTAVVMLLFLGINANAQYATGGVGKYKSQIFWLNWQLKTGTNAVGLTSVLPAAPNFSGSYGASVIDGNYTWTVIPGKIQIVGTITNHTGATKATTTNSTSWSTGFLNMYSGGGINGTFAIESSAQTDFDLELHVQINNGADWINYATPGIITADAESLGTNESISATTDYSSDGSKGWELLEYNKGTLSSANDNYKIAVTNTATASTFIATSSNNDRESTVLLARGASKLSHIQMKGTGVQNFAFGIILPFDHGDAPSGYGDASHYLPGFGTPNVLLTGNTTPNSYIYSTTYTNSPTLWLGENKPDAESSAYTSTDAKGDDIHDGNGNTTGTITNDEDGLSSTTITLNGNSTTAFATIPLTVHNTGTTSATLYGWIDFNQDGHFDADEMATTSVAAGTNGTATLVFARPDGTTVKEGDQPMARFRIISNTIGSTEPFATLLALDGETEDYQLTIATVLPIVLKSFEVQKTGPQQATLSWITSSETNNKNFIILRSSDGKNWSAIATVDSKAVNGNSSTDLDYSYIDASPLNGINYYQLKQVDFDGKSTLSAIKTLTFEGISTGFKIGPNPFKDALNIQLSVNAAQQATAVLYSISGQKVYAKNLVFNAGINNFTLNSPALASGIYILRIVGASDGLILNQKVIKE